MQLFSGDTHYNQEDYHRKHPIGTRRPRDVPEGPLKVLMSGTYKGPSGDSQRTSTKIDDFMKKLFSRSNSPCIPYLFLFLYRKNHHSKVLNGDVHGTSMGPSCGTSMGPNDGTF